MSLPEQVGHLCMSATDCLRHESQNTCPHLVDTKARPDFANVLLLSMQMGQVISGLAALDTGGLVVGGVDGRAAADDNAGDLAVGVDGSIITSSSDSDMQIVSLRCVRASTSSEMSLRSVYAFTTGSLCWSTPQSLVVRSTTVATSSLSLSLVRSTTLSLSLWPSEYIPSEQEDDVDAVERGRIRRLGLKDQTAGYY